MPEIVKCKLVKKEQLKPDIFKFSVESKEIAKIAKPGQFLEIKCSESIDPLLRRPISIYNIEESIIEFIFQVKGKGTKILAEYEVAEYIDIIGPLGNGTFKLEDYKNIAIIGGGIGIFPLHEFAKIANKQANVTIYLGFRNKEMVLLEEEFKNICNKLVLTTDDGSYEQKGFAIDVLKKGYEQNKFDAIFACGPLPMLKAVQAYAIEKDIPCQISLEEKMGCGIGACLGCAVKMIPDGNEKYGHVCKNGPVFNAKEVEI